MQAMIPASSRVLGRALWASIVLVTLVLFVPRAACQYTEGLQRTSLTFPSPPRAGLTAEISIGFTLEVDFLQGDYIELQLPGFFRDTYGNIPQGGGIYGLEWLVDSNDASINKLRIKQIQPTRIAADTPTLVSITQSAFIYLPLLGIAANQTNIKIAVVHVGTGSPVWQSVGLVQPVGVLLNTTLAFSPHFVNFPVQVDMGFTHSSDLVAGDTVTLFLDQFSLPVDTTNTTASLSACIGPYAKQTQCSTGLITVVISKQLSPVTGVNVEVQISDGISAFEAVSIRIPASVGIMLPLEGTRPNNPNHVIGTNAVLGPVPLSPPTYVQSSEAVFAPVLSYSPAKLPTGECSDHDPLDGSCTQWIDEGIDLSINFSHDAEFQPGHYVLFSLPGFTRESFQQSAWGQPIASLGLCGGTACDFSLLATSGPNSAQVGQVTWDETTKVLRLTFTAYVSSYTYLQVVIPKAHGIKLPRTGLEANQQTLLYTVYAAVISDTRSVAVSPAVGAFVSVSGANYVASTSLSLVEARAGDAASIQISWTLDGVLGSGFCVQYCGTMARTPTPASVQRELIGSEVVSVVLPGFSRLGGSLHHFAVNSTVVSAASWDEPTRTLTLTSAATVAALTPVSVMLPSSAGIRLPAAGVMLNSPTLRISTNAVSGPVLDTAIAKAPAVAQLYDVVTTFEPMRANVSVAINVKFKLNRQMTTGDSLRVSLPGFTRLGTSYIVATTASAGVSFPSTVDWYNQGADGLPGFSMTLYDELGPVNVAADTEVSVTLPIRNGIVLAPPGMPHVRASSFWRVTPNVNVSRSWLVSEISLFQDVACTVPVPVAQAVSYVASSGDVLQQTAQACAFIIWNGTQCPTNTRLATQSEMAMCKLSLCDKYVYPEYLAVRGSDGYLLGSSYSCQLGAGSAPISSSLACVATTPPPVLAFDGKSSSVWASSNFTNGSRMLRTFVGVQLPAPSSVRCALVEQPDVSLQGAWRASSLRVQASDDGITWVDVLAGSAQGGVSRITNVIAQGGSAFEAPLFAATTVLGSVLATPLLTHRPIGSFLGTPVLTFGTPVAGNATELVLSLTPGMDMVAGESLVLSLPGFTGASIPSGLVALSAKRMVPRTDAAGGTGWVQEVSYSPRGASHAWATNATSGLVEERFIASWSQVYSSLNITLMAPVYGGQPMQVTIALRNGIMLPTLGVTSSACGTGDRVNPLSVTVINGTSLPCATCAGCTGINENQITLSSNATAGPVVPTVVKSVQRVGLMLNTSVDFSSLSAVRPVNVTVSFVLNRQILAGDSVFLKLVGFRGNYTGTVTAQGWLCVWDPSSLVLSMKATAVAPAMTLVRIVVPATAGVMLPTDGLLANSDAIQISTDAVNGPVRPQVVNRSPAMGAFAGDSTRLTYTPAEFMADGTPYLEGRTASITLGFALNRVIMPGERVFFRLTGFSRKRFPNDVGDLAGSSTQNYNGTRFDEAQGNITLIDTAGIFRAFENASWNEATQTLTLTASAVVPAYQRHVVLVPSSVGLRLPLLGMIVNDPRLLVATDAAAGPNSGTPIERSPGLAKVCSAECGVWSLTCEGCSCGSVCSPQS